MYEKGYLYYTLNTLVSKDTFTIETVVSKDIDTLMSQNINIT